MPVRNAAAKSPFDSLTRPASGSPRRSRRASRPASATMTADSQRSPRAATPGGRSRRGRDQRLGVVEQPVEHAAQRRAGGRRGERLDRAAGRREIVQRDIDAVEIAVIVGAVLQMVQHLQRGAQRVRSRPSVAALAVQIEQLPADRRRRIAAILHQIVPVAVAQLDRVLAERAQHVMAMLRGDPGLRRGWRASRWRPANRCRARHHSIAAMRSSRRILSSADRAGLSAISSALRAKR